MDRAMDELLADANGLSDYLGGSPSGEEILRDALAAYARGLGADLDAIRRGREDEQWAAIKKSGSGARKVKFLREYARIGRVTPAAVVAGVSTNTFYVWVYSDEAFAEAMAGLGYRRRE